MGFENSPKCPTSFPFSDIFMQKRALTGDTMVYSQPDAELNWEKTDECNEFQCMKKILSESVKKNL